MDHKKQKIKAIIDQILPLDNDTFDLLYSNCFITIYKKGKVLLHAGEQDKQLRFVIKGVVKSYKISETESSIGKELINWIVDEGKIVCSIVSLFQKQPSNEYLETIEETEMLIIKFADLNRLIETNLTISNLINNWLIEYLVIFDRRVDMYRNAKPEQRLELFMKAQPTLLKRLTKKEIASYLNIAPGTLSIAFAKI